MLDRIYYRPTSRRRYESYRRDIAHQLNEYRGFLLRSVKTINPVKTEPPGTTVEYREGEK